MNIEGTNAAETLNGTGDADAISGNDGNDILNGLGGDDVLRGGRGVDGFDGGADDMSADPTSRGDAISFFERAATQGAVADLRTGTISSDGFGNAETMTGIESIVGDTAFADTFYGNDNGNALSGSLGDTLYGFGGDDVVSLNAAPAVADGGAGNDTLVLQGGGGWLLPDGDGDGLAELASEWGIGWYVDLGSGTVEHEFFYDYGYVQGFENVIGSHMSDFIVGDGGANAVHGGGGRDSILGEGGDDHLFGDEGNDFLMGGAGVDRFDGGADDPLDPIAADLDKIGFADVFATQAAVADLRDGTISNDGYGNVETMVNIEGIAGGTAYADSFYGNDGANLLAVGRGDTVYGFGGNDRIYLSAAPALVDGGAGDDRLQLDSGGGWLLPDSDGDGIAQVAGATPFGWQVDLGSGTLTDGYGNSGSVGGFETVIGSARDDRLYGGSGADVLEGSGGDDELLGRGGDDILRGDDGNDRLDGGAGADRMTGRAGDDVYGVDSLADIVEEYAGEGTDEVRTSLDGYSLLGTQIENLTATTDGPHDLRGGAGDNVVTGAAGNDLLRLNDGGNDSAFGGGGNDVLYFGGAFTGADVADGGEGRDALVLQGNYALTLSATNLVGIESISLQSGSRTTWGDVSNHFYDYALTTSDSNVAAGQQLIVNGQTLRAGEDFSFDGSAETDGTFLVYGGHGVDTLKGGAGNDAFFFEGDRWGPGDTVDGGAGRDALIISSGSGINHFDFGATALTGIESISLNNRYTTDPSQKPSYELVLSNGNVAPGATLIVNGSSLADRAQTVSVDGSAVHDGNLILFGGFGNDTLTGGDGADLFQGGEGIDVLTGGGGADVFRYAGPYDATSQLPDRILDFASGVDKIDLTRIDADLFTAGDQAFHWIGSAAFGGDGAASAGELRAYDFNGSWFVEGDMDGNGSADLVIQLTTPPAPVVQADFLL